MLLKELFVDGSEEGRLGQLVHNDERLAVEHKGHDHLAILPSPRMILQSLHDGVLLVGVSKLLEHGDAKVPELQVILIF